MGSIRLLNVTLFGHHGVSKAERETGSKLVFDVELEAGATDLARAASTDQLGDAIDYMGVHRALEEVVRHDHHKLLESLAGAVADRMLERFPARRVVVRIRKDNLPLSGGQVEVELERTRR